MKPSEPGFPQPHDAMLVPVRRQPTPVWVRERLARFGGGRRRSRLLLVVDDPELGRHVFTASGTPLGDRWTRSVALKAPSGLYAIDRTLPRGIDENALLELCRTSVALDRRQHESRRDPLTGLANRRRFRERLATATDDYTRYGLTLTLVLLDLDDLKKINDVAGHSAGDRALRSLADVLSWNLRRGDLAARLGGDEFALVLPGTATGEAHRLLERVRDRLHAHCDEEITFSAGLASCPADSCEPETLLRHADRDLYTAKDGSPSCRARRGGGLPEAPADGHRQSPYDVLEQEWRHLPGVAYVGFGSGASAQVIVTDGRDTAGLRNELRNLGERHLHGDGHSLEVLGGAGAVEHTEPTE